jgi:hypothetical protein
LSIFNYLRQRKINKIIKAVKNNDSKTLSNTIIPFNQLDDYAKIIIRNKKDGTDQNS